MSDLLNPGFWAFVSVVAGIFTIFALGLQIQFGFGGLLNFGHVAFMAMAAYAMAILVVKAGMPLWAASAAGLGLAVLFGVLVGLPALRLRSDYLAISTIALGEIVRYLALNLQDLTGGPQGTINLLGPGRAASYNEAWLPFLSWVQVGLRSFLGDAANRDIAMTVIVWSLALVLLTGVRALVRSPWGRVLKAVRDDEGAAASFGKNAVLYKVQAFALGSALAGLAGLLYAFQFSFFSPQDFEPLTTFFAWVIVILAGTGSTWGLPVAAVIFATLFAGSRFLSIPPFVYFDAAERASLRLILIGLILIGLIAFRPQGLFGKREEMVLE